MVFNISAAGRVNFIVFFTFFMGLDRIFIFVKMELIRKKEKGLDKNFLAGKIRVNKNKDKKELDKKFIQSKIKDDNQRKNKKENKKVVK